MFNQNITSNTEQQIQTHKYQNNTIKTLLTPQTTHRKQTRNKAYTPVKQTKTKNRAQIKPEERRKAVEAGGGFEPPISGFLSPRGFFCRGYEPRGISWLPHPALLWWGRVFCVFFGFLNLLVVFGFVRGGAILV